MRRSLIPAWFVLFAAGCAISTQQEIAMGTQYSQQINQQLPIISDPEVTRYINLLGDSIARLSDNRNLDWRFYVVDSKEVNAFAVPGGFVYVNRGLIERATKMDQLAGVLGHEIGHVVRRHSVKQMEAAQRANGGLTLVCILTRVCEYGATQAAVQVGGQALFAKFSRDDEAEADQEGIKYVTRAGIDPRGIPEMFQILLDERRSQPGALDAWFATHPLEEDRITATKAAIAEIPASTLGRLAQDSPRYQQFRSRLISLPTTAARGR
jgi:predicted Zn-dependent protease